MFALDVEMHDLSLARYAMDQGRLLFTISIVIQYHWDAPTAFTHQVEQDSFSVHFAQPPTIQMKHYLHALIGTRLVPFLRFHPLSPPLRSVYLLHLQYLNSRIEKWILEQQNWKVNANEAISTTAVADTSKDWVIQLWSFKYGLLAKWEKEGSYVIKLCP